VLTVLYSMALQFGSTHTGCAGRIGGCVRVKAIDLVNWAYTAYAWTLAITHPANATSDAYVSFDAIGVGLGLAWAGVVAYESHGKEP